MIKINDVDFRYTKKGTTIFKDFSLQFPKGKICGLFGKNGTGKSTLLYLMSGLLRPQKGEVIYKKQNVKNRRADLLNEIFIVAEEFTLPDISLKSYVKIIAPFYPNFSWTDLESNLSNFEMSTVLNMSQLSMGQKKKLYISFALATNTSLLLLDEPTNGLDIPSKSQFRKVLASQMSEERTIIISTHQVKDIETLLDHIVIINTKKALLNCPIEEVTQKLSFEQRGVNESLDTALYSEPSIEGYSVIVPNNKKKETRLNLELLFNATLVNGSQIQRIMTQSTYLK